jgi:glycosyltransferase involved in cell wall biosynthesis
MKIAQIAPLAESVPPRLYGGTERIVSYLSDELVRQGHDVTLFASGDSLTAATLVPCCKRALRLTPDVSDFVPYYLVMLDEVRRRANAFDVLHFHIDTMHYALIHDMADRTVTTLHGRLDHPDLQALYAVFDDIPLVSISNDQRRPMPPVNWVGCVHHGLPRELLRLTVSPRNGYLAFLGRISPEKRPDRAIEIAARSGQILRIAAKIDAVDQRYWHDKIEPLVRCHANIEYVGEIGDADKPAFLGNASALLFPIDWPEPFGVAMIEAMACGTPVIGWSIGSIPEVIEHGRTGFIVGSVDEAVAAVRRLSTLDRATIRTAFETRFTSERMARDYLAVYRSLPRLRTSAPTNPAHEPLAIDELPRVPTTIPDVTGRTRTAQT